MNQSWREKVYDIIFKADTPAGKLFDVLLIISILLSVLVVMLDSVPALNARYGDIFFSLEWMFTILFSVEYILRLISAPSASRYAKSFYGTVDLLAILPSYLQFIFPYGRFLQIVRVLRVLRIFRVLKLFKYLSEAERLGQALRASRRKIIVFLTVVLITVTLLGCLMYLVEGIAHGFDSIPRSIYWAIVTMTTVGYGDISPGTSLGQFIAAFIMIMGWSIIAVPTGLVTSELIHPSITEHSSRTCRRCFARGHDDDARFCKYCGEALEQLSVGDV